MTPTQMLAVAIAVVVGLAVLFLFTSRRGTPTKTGASESAPPPAQELPPAEERPAPVAGTSNDAAVQSSPPVLDSDRTRVVELAPLADATERVTAPAVVVTTPRVGDVAQGERITVPTAHASETVQAPALINEPPSVPASAPTALAAFTSVTSSTSELERSDPRHQSARRFARVAVGEIKLYHESEVRDGRVAKDLWNRLRGDINMCIQAYEKRVPADVRDRFDYLYDEIVRQLAEGDPSKLGTDAPTSSTIQKR